MADDVEMTPIAPEESAAVPPKVDVDKSASEAAPTPTASASAPGAVKTPTLGGIKKPALGGGLKPGLKLPPKPGVPAGLKLPPKPTLGGLKPGLKLPPKPGTLSMKKPAGAAVPPAAPAAPVADATPAEAAPAPAAAAPKPTLGGLKPGLKLPPKPGTLALKRPAATPAAPVAEAKPAEVKKPIVLKKPVVPAPPPAATPETAEVAPAAPATPSAAAVDAATQALKKATQNLKAVTGPIPVQAILKKTGIVAEGILTPQQAQAAKSKTSRISLDRAVGVAPVLEPQPPAGGAPLKTIRLKRPEGLKSPAATPGAAPAAAAPIAPALPPADTTVTQRKTLKLQRPGAPLNKKPTLGLKKPTAVPAAAPAVADGDNLAPVADIADIPDIPAATPSATPGAKASSGIPAAVAIASIITSIAAILLVGITVWLLSAEVAGTDNPNNFGNTAERNGVRSSLPEPSPVAK